MQSKTEDFFELETSDMEESLPRSFALYEKYSGRGIDETIRTRKEKFDKADLDTKRRLAKEVEQEITSFHAWLEETTKLDRTTAYYCAISLKSLLLGLPAGMQVALLFDVALCTKTKEIR